MTDTLERDVERGLVEGAAALGWLCLKWASPGAAGVPDRLLLMPGGRVVFVELKKPGSRPRQLQLAWHRRLRALGHDVRVISTREAASHLLLELLEEVSP